MAQAQIDLLKSIHIKNDEFIGYLSNSKFFKIYYSKVYKDYVISFNFTNCKKFVITRSMWKNFKRFIGIIDGKFN